MIESLRRLSLCAALCGILGLAASAVQAQTATYQFDLPAQSLADALRAVGRQTSKNILFDPALVEGISVPALRAELTVSDAVKQLLTGTKLSTQEIASDTVLIRNGTRDAAKKPTTLRTTAVQGTNGDMHLAQADVPERSPSSTGDPGSARDEEPQSRSLEERIALEEIVVTGTNIRGVKNPTVPVQTYDREVIEKSGYANTQQFIRSLPQTSSSGQAGATEDGLLGPGSFAQQNVDGASGVNLRGLGPSSTLTLLNGHRMSPSVFGSIVDISVIPVAAIERIEVLTDGASAVYGADAVAGVVNFVLRDYDGAETSVLYGEVTDGSLDELVIGQTFGATWDSGGVFVAAEYHDRGPLHTDERSFTADAAQPTDIMPPFDAYSGILSWHQQMSSNLDFFGDALISEKSTRRLYSEGIGLSYDASVDIDAQNVHGGIGYAPFGDWRIEAAGTYSRQHNSTTYNAYSPPFPILGTEAFHSTFTTTSGDLKADGTIFNLPRGAVKAAVGLAYRDEDFSSFDAPTLFSPSLSRALERSVSSQFAEVHAALVDESSSRPFLHKLAVSAAVRRDDYSDVGETSNPKFGVSWSPVSGLDLRGSWGTSFRAPSATEQIVDAFVPSMFNYNFTDPSGVGVARVFYVSAAGESLEPESSRNWTFGLDYNPDFLPGLNLSVNYYDIEFSDRIIRPPFDPGALTTPDVYGSLITPLGDDAAAAAYLADFAARGGTFLDLFGFGSTGVRYVYNGYQQNAAKVRQSGFDVIGSYGFEIGESRVDARVNASVINEILTAFTATSMPTDLVDTYNNPLGVRIRANLSWSSSGWLINGAINYSDSYKDTSAVPAGTVDSLTTFDLTVRFSPDRQGANNFLAGTTFGLSVLNLFDHDPPYVEGIALSRAHYDVGNADPMGRYVSIEVRHSW